MGDVLGAATEKAYLYISGAIKKPSDTADHSSEEISKVDITSILADIYAIPTDKLKKLTMSL